MITPAWAETAWASSPGGDTWTGLGAFRGSTRQNGSHNESWARTRVLMPSDPIQAYAVDESPLALTAPETSSPGGETVDRLPGCWMKARAPTRSRQCSPSNCVHKASNSSEMRSSRTS